jgi:methionyl-tRNA synthetase
MKPAKLRGVQSTAMLLAASSEDGASIELVIPPTDAAVGERITFDGHAFPVSLGLHTM